MAYEARFDPGKLLPRQPIGVNEEGVEHYRDLIDAGENIPPIPLVAAGDGRIIVANGHHRAVAHFQKGALVPGVVHETDDDIAGNTDDDTLRYYDKIKDFVDDYEQTILPMARELGRATMADYVRRHEEEVAARSVRHDNRL